MSRWRLLLALLPLLAFMPSPAPAHEMSMAEMEVRETSPGDFLWQWTARDERQSGTDMNVIWPAGCTAQENLLRCGEQGLTGELRVQGVGERYSAAIVRVSWRDGKSRVMTLTARQPAARLYGSAEDQRGGWEIASAYGVLGVEHILTGIDHLLFVIGLLFLVGLRRQLVLTISAFTLAHSLTLALSALGWLTLRPPPVEATIALSILLVAGEALRTGNTLSRRWPALVAFLFGLMHGLGFAGALAQIGLPQQHLLVALLAFNVGVEFGQLFVVGLAFGAYHLLVRYARLDWARVPALYCIGGLAGYWTIARVAAIVS
jgi:hydrogenase/urease accessory protein HupE